MVLLYLSPTWFAGYDIFLEVLFALVTLAIAFYSLKIYKLSGQRESKLFGISFLLISISYSLWAILNGFALSQLNENQCALYLENVGMLINLGIYGHILFFLSGIATLAYMTLKIESLKAYSLILLLVLLATILVEEKQMIIYLLSSILLIYIISAYIEEYSKNKNKKVLMILLAFFFLFFGRLDFIFSTISYRFYVLGHVLELAAYALALISLILVIKHQQKNKSMGLRRIP